MKRVNIFYFFYFKLWFVSKLLILLNVFERGRKSFFFLEKTKRSIKLAGRGIQLTTLLSSIFIFSASPRENS